MEEKQKNYIRVDDVITLCHIVEDFENFNRKFFDFLDQSKDKGLAVLALWKYATNKRCLPKKQIIKFYKENSVVIDAINKYSDLLYFAAQNYNLGEKNVSINQEFEKLIKYIKENKNEVNKMLSVLNKLKILGIYMLIFEPKTDFSEEKFSIHRSFNDNIQIIYLDNLETIPSYDTSKIYYKSTTSNYKITFIKSLVEKYSEITINSLIFDANKLPEVLSKKNMFDKIVEDWNTKQTENSAVRNSVDISVSIDALTETYENIKSKINQIDVIDSKKELLEQLKKIKEAIEQMNQISRTYNQQMIESHQTITDELLIQEKNKYVRQRKIKQ